MTEKKELFRSVAEETSIAIGLLLLSSITY
jgi:hypothetical protein